MRVLCVEDDKTTAKLVEKMLDESGHRCDTTRLGEDAVDLAKRGNYDIILLDIMLPDIDGYEVIHRLRKAGVDTPFLIQSGLLDRDDGNAAEGLGVSEYLIKPYNKSELIQRMRKVVARSRMAEPTVPEAPCEDENGSPDENSDRRRHRRFKTVKSAEVLHKKGFECVILSMSHGGAAIRLPDAEMECPRTFALKLQGKRKLHCLLCWRFQDKIGVKFL